MKQINQEWSRRNFIIGATSAGALLLLNPFSGWASEKRDSRVAKIVARTMGIDSHNHVDVPFNPSDFAAQSFGFAEEIKKSGLSAICMTFCVDRPTLNEKGEAFDRFMLALDEMDILLEQNNMSRALNLADLKAAKKKGKAVVIQSVEGGHFIEDKLERIEIAYKRGLRHLGLLHDNPSFVPIGDIYTNPAQYGGLTEIGTQIVKECNRLGILVDLTHCSDEAINDALEISTKPVIISHTGLNTQLGTNEKAAQMMMPRLIRKEQAKIVADAGGVIGVWTHLAESPEQFATNIRAVADVVGVDHVAIGTDSRMINPNLNNTRFGGQTNAAWESMQEGFFYTVVEAMLKSGFTEDEIVKIGGGNYCRIFDQATTV